MSEPQILKQEWAEVPNYKLMYPQLGILQLPDSNVHLIRLAIKNHKYEHGDYTSSWYK